LTSQPMLPLRLDRTAGRHPLPYACRGISTYYWECSSASAGDHPGPIRVLVAHRPTSPRNTSSTPHLWAERGGKSPAPRDAPEHLVPKPGWRRGGRVEPRPAQRVLPMAAERPHSNLDIPQ
jgi:hypothetical protein